MTTLLIVIHIIVSLFLIGIVLLQHGKGADIGATFGGSNQSLFGTEGPIPLLNKITTLAAIVFMGTSVALAYLSTHKSSGSIMKDLQAQAEQAPVQQPPVTVPMPADQPAATEAPQDQPTATEASKDQQAAEAPKSQPATTGAPKKAGKQPAKK